MSIALENSKTCENLMRAFAGESQARNRYLFAASLARKENLYVVSQVFTFTADQERAHAKAFWDQLAPLAGRTLTVDGTYPVDGRPEVLEQLRSARHNEYQEWERDYPAFAQTAREEGFPEIAALFDRVAAVEKIHGDRFDLLARRMEDGSLFTEGQSTAWMCLNCGHIVFGESAPPACPLCSHNQGFYVRLDEAPFTALSLAE